MLVFSGRCVLFLSEADIGQQLQLILAQIIDVLSNLSSNPFPEVKLAIYGPVNWGLSGLRIDVQALVVVQQPLLV